MQQKAKTTQASTKIQFEKQKKESLEQLQRKFQLTESLK